MDSTWIIYGTMGGCRIQDADFLKLLRKRASILTSTLRNRPTDYKSSLINDMVKDLYPGFESGELKPIIHKLFPLS